MKYLYWLILTIIVFSSCSKEITYDTTSEYDLTDEVIVLSYTDFFDEDDVEIMDNDTTRIKINSDYLDSCNKRMTVGKVVCVWRSINTIPFIRKVNKVEKDGSDIYITTERGDISDVFDSIDISLSTDIYVNNYQDNPAKRYHDGEKYHPAVIIWNDPNSNDDDNSYATAEQLSTKANHYDVVDYSFNTNMTIEEEYVKVGIVDGAARVWVSVDMDLNLPVFGDASFHTIFRGGIDVRLPFTIQGKLSATFDKEVELIPLPTYCVVFWIGIVPFGITLEPGVVIDADVELGASAELTIPVIFNTSYDIGEHYNFSNGIWTPSSSFNQAYNVSLGDVSFSTGLFASSSLALYFKTGVYIYGAAGPYLKIGPKVEANVSGKVITETGQKDKLSFTTTGVFSLGGKIGGELKIWKWSISKWETGLSLFNAEIWKYSKEVVVN